jgi:hypothetical protein
MQERMISGISWHNLWLNLAHFDPNIATTSESVNPTDFCAKFSHVPVRVCCQLDLRGVLACQTPGAICDGIVKVEMFG